MRTKVVSLQTQLLHLLINLFQLLTPWELSWISLSAISFNLSAQWQLHCQKKSSGLSQQCYQKRLLLWVIVINSYRGYDVTIAHVLKLRWEEMKCDVWIARWRKRSDSRTLCRVTKSSAARLSLNYAHNRCFSSSLHHLWLIHSQCLHMVNSALRDVHSY